MFANGVSDVRRVEDKRSNADQDQFDVVCRQGRVTGYECGQIGLTDQSAFVGPNIVDHLWFYDEPSIPGDSGGPFFLRFSVGGVLVNHAYGILSGTDEETLSAYSTIDWVSATTLRRPCYSGDCGL